MTEPTNRELKIMLDNHVNRSEERHEETLKVLTTIQHDGEITKEQALKTNGRVLLLEKWATDAQKIIEATAEKCTTTASDYGKDKVRIITGGALFMLLGGTIIALSIMAIDTKIQEGIETAFNEIKDTNSFQVE